MLHNKSFQMYLLALIKISSSSPKILQKPKFTTIDSGERLLLLYKPNLSVDKSPWDQDAFTGNPWIELTHWKEENKNKKNTSYTAILKLSYIFIASFWIKVQFYSLWTAYSLLLIGPSRHFFKYFNKKYPTSVTNSFPYSAFYL